MMVKCPKCQKDVFLREGKYEEFFVGSLHKCPPVWTVWSDDLGCDKDDAHQIRALDEEEAARIFAEKTDEEDPWFYRGGTAEILVHKAEGPVTVKVWGEPNMLYHSWRQK